MISKIIIITSIGALAFFGTMNAQEINFGVKAGYSLSSIKAEGAGAPEYDSKSSFYIGGLVKYKLTDKVDLQGELLYSETGGKYSESSSETMGGTTYSLKMESDLKFGNLMLPVSVKYYLAENISLSGGLNFALILTAKAILSTEISGGGMSEKRTETEDIKEDIKSLNFAPFVGAEYQLPNGIFFDARYNLGLTNLVKDPEGDESARNSFLQIGIGYKF